MKNASQILLVDDDVTLLQALPQALHLRIDGVGVDTCDSALEALKQIQEYEYDAIVSDIKMPGMDGLTLLAKIQALRPETPTLLITGHGEHDLAIQALRGGAYDFIQKPIDRDYIVAALRRAIQTHQLRRQVREYQRALELHAHSLERVVQNRTQELVQAKAAKDTFLSMVSHELRVPLASLEGRVHLLRRQLDHADSDNMVSLGLEDIERSIGRLEVLAKDLLDASLIETNRFVLHRKRCDLVELCRHLLEEYTAGEGPALRFEAPGEPIEAEVDPDRISQALLNVLSNARKYSPKRYPITVTLHRAGCEAIISVCDRGAGIPPEMLPHIFEPYSRVLRVEVQTGSQTGLGLGLYIAWKLVERHAGHIDVQSVPGEGSVFSLVPRLAQRACGRANLDLVSESHTEQDDESARGGKDSGMESKKGRRREEGRTSREKRKGGLHAEKQACPRRGNPTAVKTGLNLRQTERGGKSFWNAEQFDRHLIRGWDAPVASEPFSPGETSVCSLRAGEDHVRSGWRSGGGWRQAHFDALVAHELQTGAPVDSPAPIARSRSGAEPTWSGCNSTLTWRGFAVAVPFH